MESNGSNGGSPSTCIAESIGIGLHQSTMPKGVKRFSGDIMLYLFDLEPDDFRSVRPEIIRL